MAAFGKTSFSKLKTCDIRIVKVCNVAIKTFDFAVLCGARGANDQMVGFRNGKSNLVYPLGRHNPKLDKKDLMRLSEILQCGTDITEGIKHADVQTLKLIDDEAKYYKSRAVDIVPYLPNKPHVDWRYFKELRVAINAGNHKEGKEIEKNIGRWHELAGRVLGVAESMGIKLAWGGHWKNFVDLPHFELAE